MTAMAMMLMAERAAARAFATAFATARSAAGAALGRPVARVPATPAAGILGDAAFAWTAGADATLRAGRAGRLRVLAGGAWVTLDDRLDDWVLGRGEVLDVPAGARLHVGAWRPGETPRLAWCPAAATPGGGMSGPSRLAALLVSVALTAATFGGVAEIARPGASAAGSAVEIAVGIARRAG